MGRVYRPVDCYLKYMSDRLREWLQKEVEDTNKVAYMTIPEIKMNFRRLQKIYGG